MAEKRLYAVVKYAVPELTIRQHFIGGGYAFAFRQLREDISTVFKNCGLLPLSISVETLPMR